MTHSTESCRNKQTPQTHLNSTKAAQWNEGSAYQQSWRRGSKHRINKQSRKTEWITQRVSHELYFFLTSTPCLISTPVSSFLQLLLSPAWAKGVLTIFLPQKHRPTLAFLHFLRLSLSSWYKGSDNKFDSYPIQTSVICTRGTSRCVWVHVLNSRLQLLQNSMFLFLSEQNLLVLGKKKKKTNSKTNY